MGSSSTSQNVQQTSNQNWSSTTYADRTYNLALDISQQGLQGADLVKVLDTIQQASSGKGTQQTIAELIAYGSAGAQGIGPLAPLMWFGALLLLALVVMKR